MDDDTYRYDGRDSKETKVDWLGIIENSIENANLGTFQTLLYLTLSTVYATENLKRWLIDCKMQQTDNGWTHDIFYNMNILNKRSKPQMISVKKWMKN